MKISLTSPISKLIPKERVCKESLLLFKFISDDAFTFLSSFKMMFLWSYFSRSTAPGPLGSRATFGCYSTPCTVIYCHLTSITWHWWVEVMGTKLRPQWDALKCLGGMQATQGHQWPDRSLRLWVTCPFSTLIPNTDEEIKNRDVVFRNLRFKVLLPKSGVAFLTYHSGSKSDYVVKI